MEQAIAVPAVAGFVAAWHFFFYKRSGGRICSPLWIAFGTTTGAAIFLVAGCIGYILDRHDRFVARTAWAGGVIWSEVSIGLVMTLVAMYFWRKDLRSIRAT